MNHTFKQAPPGRATKLATYADPDVPLAPGLAAAMGIFLKLKAFETSLTAIHIFRREH